MTSEQYEVIAALMFGVEQAKELGILMTGHCAEKRKPGGCQLHNLDCAYPNCDRRPALSPAKAGG